MANLSDFQFQICQINSVVGDIATNEKLITEQIKRAEAEGNVDILIFPELCLSGYFPRDLLYYDSFIDEIHSAMKRIASSVRSTIAIIGSPWYDEDKGVLRNAAVILEGGTIDTVVFKTLLPDYDVFDESRYFLSDAPRVIEIKGIKVGLQICEDLWDHLWMHNYNVTEEQLFNPADALKNLKKTPKKEEKEVDEEKKTSEFASILQKRRQASDVAGDEEEDEDTLAEISAEEMKNQLQARLKQAFKKS